MSRRAILITLFVSLAVNLFVVGAVVGGLVMASRQPPPRPAPTARMGPALWKAGEGLDPEERRAFRHVLREEGAVANQRLRAAREARREAWGMMAREPFDGPAVARALDQARAAEMEARRDVEHRIVDFAATLPPPARARFAEHLAPADRESDERPRRPARPPQRD